MISALQQRGTSSNGCFPTLSIPYNLLKRSSFPSTSNANTNRFFKKILPFYYCCHALVLSPFKNNLAITGDKNAAFQSCSSAQLSAFNLMQPSPQIGGKHIPVTVAHNIIFSGSNTNGHSSGIRVTRKNTCLVFNIFKNEVPLLALYLKLLVSWQLAH